MVTSKLNPSLRISPFRLSLIACILLFANNNNSNIEKLITKKFNGKYDSIINLVGYIDNKGFENTNLKSILKSLTANAILPILIEKILVKRMLSQKWGRILNCSSIGV